MRRVRKLYWRARRRILTATRPGSVTTTRRRPQPATPQQAAPGVLHAPATALPVETKQTVSSQQLSSGPWMRLRLARSKLHHNEFVEAGEMLEKLLADEPDFRPAKEWYGVALAKRGKIGRATPLLRSALGDPDVDPTTVALLGRVLCQRRHWKELESLLAQFPELHDDWLTTSTEGPLGDAWRLAQRVVEPARSPDTLGVLYQLPFTVDVSLSSSLNTMFGRHLTVIHRGDRPDEIRHRLDNLGARRKTNFVRLHHPYPLRSGRDERWFTFVGEPVGRFVSGFERRLQPGIMPTRDFVDRPSLERTIEHAERHDLHNMASRELAILHPSLRDTFFQAFAGDEAVKFEDDLAFVRATAHLSHDALHDLASSVLRDRFHTVGVVDHQQAGYLILCARAGIGVPAVPADAEPPGDGSVALTDVQIRRIEALYTIDDALYKESLAAFEVTYGDVIGALDAQPAVATSAR